MEDTGHAGDETAAFGGTGAGEDGVRATRGPRAPIGRRLQVALLVMGVVALIAAVAMLGADGIRRPVPVGDPSASLEAALDDGTPAYVLIHSLT